MDGVEDPGKGWRTAAKLLRQGRNEEKALEGLKMLRNSPSLRETLEQGGALPLVTALFDARQTLKVQVDAGTILAEYLESFDAENFFEVGRMKKSSPCNGVKRFLTIIVGNCHAEVQALSWRCLSKLVNCFFNGIEPEEQCGVIARKAVAAIGKNDAEWNLKTAAAGFLEAACQKGSRFLLEADAFKVALSLQIALDGTQDIKLREQLAKFLFNGSAHQEVLQDLLEVAEESSTFFIKSSKQFLESKGEVKESLLTTTIHAYLLWLWLMQQQASFGAPHEIEENEEEKNSRRVPSKECFDHVEALLKGPKGISDVISSSVVFMKRTFLQKIHVSTKFAETLVGLLKEPGRASLQCECACHYLLDVVSEAEEATLRSFLEPKILLQLISSEIGFARGIRLLLAIFSVSKNRNVSAEIISGGFLPSLWKILEVNDDSETIASVLKLLQPIAAYFLETEEPLREQPDWRVLNELCLTITSRLEGQEKVLFSKPLMHINWKIRDEEEGNLLTWAVEATPNEVGEYTQDIRELLLNTLLLTSQLHFHKELVDFGIAQLISASKSDMFEVENASLALLNQIARHQENGRQQILTSGISEEDLVSALKSILCSPNRDWPTIEQMISLIDNLSRVPNLEDFEQPKFTDDFAASVLDAGILPLLLFLTSVPELSKLHLEELCLFLISRGCVRSNYWKTWEEPALDESGNEIFETITDEEGNEVLKLVLELKGPGPDPNKGPTIEDWKLKLDILGDQALKVGLQQGFSVTSIVCQLPGSVTTSLLKVLIECGADLDSRDRLGRSSLMYAVACKDVEKVEMLLNTGAVDVDAVDNDGWNVLRWSFLEENIMRLLCSNSVDLNLSEHEFGTYPLHWLAMPYQKEVIIAGKSMQLESSHEMDSLSVASLILKSGADCNLCDNEGRSPLHASIQRGLTDLTFILLENGAEPNLLDAQNCLPLHFLCEGNCTQSAALLDALLARGSERPLKRGQFSDHGRGKARWERVAHRVELLLEEGLCQLEHPSAIADILPSVQELLSHASESGWTPYQCLFSGKESRRLLEPFQCEPGCGYPHEDWSSLSALEQRTDMFIAIHSMPGVSSLHLLSEKASRGASLLSIFIHSLPRNLQDSNDATRFLETLSSACKSPSFLMKDITKEDELGLTPLHALVFVLPSENVVSSMRTIYEENDVNCADLGRFDPMLLLLGHTSRSNDTFKAIFEWLSHGWKRFQVVESQAKDLVQLGFSERLTGTPITVTASIGDESLFQEITTESESDLDICEPLSGKTAMHLAADAGHTSCVIWLALNGANMHAQENERGESPVFSAIRSNLFDSVEKLIGSSSDPGIFFNQLKVTNNQGETPLLVAERLNMESCEEAELHSSDQIVRLLLEASCEKSEQIKEERNKWDPQNFIPDSEASTNSYDGQIHAHECFSKGIMYRVWQGATAMAIQAEEDSKTRNEAATGIQSVCRGYLTRKHLQEKPSNSKMKKKKKSKSKSRGKGKSNKSK